MAARSSRGALRSGRRPFVERDLRVRVGCARGGTTAIAHAAGSHLASAPAPASDRRHDDCRGRERLHPAQQQPLLCETSPSLVTSPDAPPSRRAATSASHDRRPACGGDGQRTHVSCHARAASIAASSRRHSARRRERSTALLDASRPCLATRNSVAVARHQMSPSCALTRRARLGGGRRAAHSARALHRAHSRRRREAMNWRRATLCRCCVRSSTVAQARRRWRAARRSGLHRDAANALAASASRT